MTVLLAYKFVVTITVYTYNIGSLNQRRK